MPKIRAESIAAHKELQRRELLDAMRELLAAVGSADVGLGDVAARVGIGRTTVYEYFRDKDDLIACLVEETLPEVLDRLLAETPEDLSIVDKLGHLAVATVEFVITDPVLGLILHRELPRLSDEAQERIRFTHADLAHEMVGLYVAGVRSGVFRDMPRDLAGRFINDVILSAGRAVIAASDPRGRFPEVVEAMRAFLFHGLAA